MILENYMKKQFINNKNMVAINNKKEIGNNNINIIYSI